MPGAVVGSGAGSLIDEPGYPAPPGALEAIGSLLDWAGGSPFELGEVVGAGNWGEPVFAGCGCPKSGWGVV